MHRTSKSDCEDTVTENNSRSPNSSLTAGHHLPTHAGYPAKIGRSDHLPGVAGWPVAAEAVHTAGTDMGTEEEVVLGVEAGAVEKEQVLLAVAAAAWSARLGSIVPTLPN